VTRALKTPQEKKIRVLSTIMSPLEISWAKETLFLNFSFVLSDEAGELHPPKDNDRKEIAIEPAEVTAIRAQILADTKLMADWGYPLAAGFHRQLGMTTEEIKAKSSKRKANRKPPRPKAERPQKAARSKAAAPAQRLSTPPSSPPSSDSEEQSSSSDESVEDENEIDTIVEARPTAGRARCWYLVQWKGYHPSWEAWRIMGEPGSPVQSWESARNVEGTEAWSRWQEEQ